MEIYSTTDLHDVVARSESIEEYKQIFFNLDDQKKSWMYIIDKIIMDHGYSVSELANLCNVSRQTVQKWIKGSIPKSRSTFIKIGFAANYNLEQMNYFLQRYGCCNGLYAKCLEDSVCIFVLSSDAIEHTYKNYEKIIELIRKKLTPNIEGDASLKYETGALSLELLELQTIPQLEEFICHRASVYRKAYYRLYEYIEKFIQQNLLDEDDNVYLLANSQQWSSSLRQCASEISQKKWYPQRNKLISLGLHLNMTLCQINTMLNLAQMECLCAKTPFENAIIYALENAELEDNIHCDGTNELCLYVRRIFERLDLAELNFYLDELPSDTENDL